MCMEWANTTTLKKGPLKLFLLLKYAKLLFFSFVSQGLCRYFIVCVWIE